MRRIFSALILGLSFSVLTAPLTSDDALAQKAKKQKQHDWNGYYSGLNLGGAFGASDFATAIGSGFPFFEGQVYPGLEAISGRPNVIAAYSANSASSSSLTGGVQIGYNTYANGILFGLEADANLVHIRNSVTTTATGLPFGFPLTLTGPTAPLLPPSTYTFHNELDADYVLTLRPRIGTDFAGGIAYATGGLALTQLNFKHSFRATGGAFDGLFEDASASEIKLGWSLGGGFEFPLSDTVSFKTEYLFTRFGDVTSDHNKILGPTSPTNFGCGENTGQGAFFFGDATIPTPQQCFDHKADLDLHMLRLGLNFKM
jgi:outer membrane immunogenic protein